MQILINIAEPLFAVLFAQDVTKRRKSKIGIIRVIGKRELEKIFKKQENHCFGQCPR